MVQERMCRAESGKTIKLDMHKENIIHQLLGGDVYTTTNHVNYCKGTDIIVHGLKMDNTIIFDQLRILQTKIYSERDKRLISNTDMSFLPTTCNALHGVCFAQDATYIWDIESYHSTCDFSFYKETSFHLIEPRTYIDDGNKILIRFPETKTTTITCGDRQKQFFSIRKLFFQLFI